MAQVKFFRGSNYNAVTHKDCIFFNTTTQELILNGLSYGVSTSDSAILKRAITDVKFISPNEILFTCGDGTHQHFVVTLPEANSDHQGLMSKAHFSKLEGIELGAQVNVIEQVKVDGVLGQLKDGKVLEIDGKFAKADAVYTKEAVVPVILGMINTSLTSVYKFKGTKATYDELVAIASPAVGDVYQVQAGKDLYPAGTNWAWDGDAWEPLSGFVDLTGINTKISANETAIAKNAEDIVNNAAAAAAATKAVADKLGETSDGTDKNTAFGKINNLEELISGLTGGSTESVSEQISNAIDALKGNDFTYADLSAMEDAIRGEITTRDNQVKALQKEIDDEEKRAADEEARLLGLINGNADAITALQGVDSGFENRIAAAESTITKLDGTVETDGSVKKQIKDAVDAEALIRQNADNALSERIKNLEDSVGEGGDVAGDIAANKTAIEAIQKDYLKKADKDELQGSINGVQGSLNTHINDSVKHITADERDAWNAAEQNAKNYAKNYADGLASNYDAAGSAEQALNDAKTFMAANYDTKGSAAAVQGKLDEEAATARAAEKKNADAISALTKTVNDNETDIEGKMTAMGGRMTTAEGTIAGHTTSINSNTQAIDALQKNTVNGKAISGNPTLDGRDITLTEYTTVTGGFITATHTVNAAVSALENALIWHEAN